MSESSDRGQESNPPKEISTSVRTAGVNVRKVATHHGQDAVAVYLTLRSRREERCTVRITDAIPDSLRDHELEFHPKYDPVNWTRGDGVVVYAATLNPGQRRTTVYGVAIDDESRLEWFDTDPDVDVIVNERPPAPDETGTPVDVADESSFAFGPRDQDDDPAEAEGSREPTTGPARADQTANAVERARVTESVDVVEAFVADLERRELSDAERTVIRQALDLDARPSVGTQIQSLRESVAALEEAVGGDRRRGSRVRQDSRSESAADESTGRYRGGRHSKGRR